MRVVFLTHNYPRHQGDVAGNFLHPLARALRDRGNDIRVVAPSDQGRDGESELDGVPVQRVRYSSPRHETLAYTGTMASALRSPAGLHALAGMIRAFSRAVRQHLAEDPTSCFHAHWWFPAALAIPRRVPTVVTCHGTDVRLLDTSRISRLLGRRVITHVAVPTTVSHYLAGIIARRTGRILPESAIQPMPLAERERPVSIGGDGIVLLGRLTPQKRIELAFEAVALARRSGCQVPVTVVGDGPERPRLTSLANQLGLGEVVRFVGAVAPDEVPRWLESADAFLMTAHDEGLGLAAAEALIQGVPAIVCNDGGGLLDLVPRRRGGRIVDPTAEALAGAIIEVVGDTDERAAAADAGQELASRLTPERVAERCEEWYRIARSSR